jgi:hypothetical protein
MDTIFGRWEIALADDVYITTRNGSYFVHRLTNITQRTSIVNYL